MIEAILSAFITINACLIAYIAFTELSDTLKEMGGEMRRWAADHVRLFRMLHVSNREIRPLVDGLVGGMAFKLKTACPTCGKVLKPNGLDLNVRQRYICNQGHQFTQRKAGGLVDYLTGEIIPQS
jgi:hypothetical protein